MTASSGSASFFEQSDLLGIAQTSANSAAAAATAAATAATSAATSAATAASAAATAASSATSAGSAITSAINTAIPAAAGKLFGGTGTPGVLVPVTVSARFTLSSNTLDVAAATASSLGVIQPDNVTTFVNGGVLSAVGGGGGGGTGSGTVGGGTAGQLAYYAGSGTAVGGLTVSTSFTISGGTMSLAQATTTTRGGVTFSTSNPNAPGTADPGASTSAARADHTHPLPATFNRSTAGLAPASGGTTGTASFLREDGAWAVPPGTGGGGGGSSNLTISNTYTAPSGAIAIADAYAVVNIPSGGALTLADGNVDGHPLTINNFGAGTTTITIAHFQGKTNQALTLAPGQIVSLVWFSSLSSYTLAA